MLNVMSGKAYGRRLTGARSFTLGLPTAGFGRLPKLPCPNRVIKFLLGNNYFFVAVPEAFWNPDVWE